MNAIKTLETRRIQFDKTDNAEFSATVDNVKELLESMPDLLALYLIKWGNRDPDATAVYERTVAAYNRCTKE